MDFVYVSYTNLSREPPTNNGINRFPSFYSFTCMYPDLCSDGGVVLEILTSCNNEVTEVFVLVFLMLLLST